MVNALVLLENVWLVVHMIIMVQVELVLDLIDVILYLLEMVINLHVGVVFEYWPGTDGGSMYYSPVRFNQLTSLSVSSVDGSDKYGYNSKISYDANSAFYGVAPGRNISGGHYGNSGSVLNPAYNGSRSLLPVPSLATSMNVLLLNKQQMVMSFASRGCNERVLSWVE